VTPRSPDAAPGYNCPRYSQLALDSRHVEREGGHDHGSRAGEPRGGGRPHPARHFENPIINSPFREPTRHFEVGRALRANASGDDVRVAAALERCLELFDLTLADPRWKGRRKEIARARELVCDCLVGDNEHGQAAESLEAHFLPYMAAARLEREGRA